MNDLSDLQQKIAYVFRDEDMLKLALTHASHATSNNQRLEFLGDALLGLVVAEDLFFKHFSADEGELTRRKAMLVNKSTLAQIAARLELGKLLRVGASYAGSVPSANMLADAYEALIAAVYIDGGKPAAELMIGHCFERYFSHDYASFIPGKDAKTQLQEFCQRCRYALPVYEVVREEINGANMLFHIKASVTDLALVTEALARSKQAAQQQAAQALIVKLEKKGLWTYGSKR